MLRAIMHRGPDDWGMTFFGFQPDALVDDDGHVEWIESPDTRLALGHQHLLILDLGTPGLTNQCLAPMAPIASPSTGKFIITSNFAMNSLPLR